jgi:hypothetical protein
MQSSKQLKASKAPAASSKASGKRKAPAAASSSGVSNSRDLPPPSVAAPAPVSLSGHRRGTEVVTKVKSEYGARNSYDFDDVCAICEKFRAGTYKTSDLRKRNEDGSPFFSIPRSTLQFWLDDDDKIQKQKTSAARAVRRDALVRRASRARAQAPREAGAGHGARRRGREGLARRVPFE